MTEIASAQTLMGTNLGSNATLFSSTTTAGLAAKQMGRETIRSPRYALTATQTEQIIGYVDPSRFPNGATVISVSFLSLSGIAASNTDYYTYTIKKYTAAGASGTTVLATTTKAADLVSLAALAGVAVTTITSAALVAGAPITFAAAKSASGADHDLIVTIVLEAL